MKSKKIKGCLLSFFIITVIFVVVTVMYIMNILNLWGEKTKQAEKDSVELSTICDTIPYITERPRISFYYFDENEIDELEFYILRNNKSLRDTIIKRRISSDFHEKSLSMEIPYNCFLKTDTIVVMTKDSLYFSISGYHHYAYLHYGMFGYLGSSDCRFSETCMINGRKSNGTLSKYEGWKNASFSESKNARIYQDMYEFNIINENMPISYDKACKLFTEETKNASPRFLYYENGFYIFGESNALNEAMTIIKIDSTTGECTKSPNFPFD